MAESVVFSALLGWPGSRPSAWNARQDIPPFRQHGQRCQPLLQPAEGTGRDLLLFSLFVYLLYSGSKQRGSSLAKFITIVKCSQLHWVGRMSWVGTDWPLRGGEKKPVKFTIQLQDFISLDFRKQVRAGYSTALKCSNPHRSLVQNISSKFFN